MKKYIFFIPFIFILLIILFLLSPKGKYLVFKEREKAILEEKKITCSILPEGKFNLIPTSFTITFSTVFEGVEGILIDEYVIDSFLEISPKVNAFGKWISEKTFEVYFKQFLDPDTKYNISIKRVPFFTENIKLKKQDFSFTTPSFEVINIFQSRFEKDYAIIQLEFNFDVKELKNEFFEIYDFENIKIDIKDIYFPQKKQKCDQYIF